MPGELKESLKQSVSEANARFEAGDYEGGGEILGELQANIYSTAGGTGGLVALGAAGGAKAVKAIKSVDNWAKTTPNRARVLNPTVKQLASAEKLGVDPRWVKSNGDIDWPPNYGFKGGIEIRELQPGQTFDRYGGRFDEKGNFSDRGAFASPIGVPFDQRALPNSSRDAPYRKYKVLIPLPQVNAGTAASWFGKPGGGIQYQLPVSIDELVKNGFIVPIN